MGTMDGVKEGDQGLNSGIMADSMQTNTIAARHEMAVAGMNYRGCRC